MYLFFIEWNGKNFDFIEIISTKDEYSK